MAWLPVVCVSFLPWFVSNACWKRFATGVGVLDKPFVFATLCHLFWFKRTTQEEKAFVELFNSEPSETTFCTLAIAGHPKE